MRRLLVAASVIYASAIFLFAISPFMILSVILLTVVGSMQMSYRVLARAIIQEECPDYLLVYRFTETYLLAMSSVILTAWLENRLVPN